jgi:hypothetical protein
MTPVASMSALGSERTFNEFRSDRLFRMYALQLLSTTRTIPDPKLALFSEMSLTCRAAIWANLILLTSY